MVKGGLKRKKADKAKNQLKVSKKGAKKARAKGGDIRLPKGLNVTDASFKTQKIVLLNQAQSASSKEDQLAGLVTKKKLSLTDLLSKVNNLSLSTRLDGLDGLKELLTNHQKVLDDNLTLILSRLAPLLSERERKLRRAGVVILEFMLTKVEPLTLESLYPLLCAHLCCGLSHIDSDIQFESIRILDTIIESQPQFVVHHRNQILPNCMNQISSSSQSSSAQAPSQNDVKIMGKSSGMNIGVHDHIGGDVSALQWRSMVIERIRKMLLILHNVQKDRISSKFDTLQRKVDSRHEISATSCFDIGLYFDKYGISGAQYSFFDDAFPSSDHRPKQDHLFAKKLAKDMFPIILETWSEAVLDTHSNRKKKTNVIALQNIVKEESVPILLSLVKTIEVILKLLKYETQNHSSGSKLDGIENYLSPEIFEKIMEQFPYDVSASKQGPASSGKYEVTSEEMGSKSIVAETQTSSPYPKNRLGAYQLNIGIVSFFVQLFTLDQLYKAQSSNSHFPIHSMNSKKKKREEIVISYTTSILLYLSGDENQGTLLGNHTETDVILMQNLKQISSLCAQHPENAKLFGNLIARLYKSNSSNRHVVELMSYLVTQQDSIPNLNEAIQIFVKELPMLLLSEQVTNLHIKTIQSLLQRNDKTFITTFYEVLPVLPEKLDQVVRVLSGSKKIEFNILASQLLKTVAIIMYNSSISLKAKNQGEDWKRKLSQISEYTTSNQKMVDEGYFYKNIISQL